MGNAVELHWFGNLNDGGDMKQKLVYFMIGWGLLIGSVRADLYADAMTAYDIGDFAQSARLLHPVAKKGDARAQYDLGQLYEQGKGVNQNFQQAMRWYRLSAMQGHSRAQYNLGQMYEEGLVVNLDFVKAYMWYTLAAAKGLHVAESNRDYIAQKMTPAQISKSQVLARECEAVQYQDCD